MFTPQEVREHSTSFEKAVFGGYSMGSVDDFISPLVEDYSALYKENAVLKSKMKVLVDRLEEYRKQEESLNKAIMAAQKTCDDMVAETQRKCAKMMSDTEQSLRERNQDLKKELAAEAERVSRARKTAATFIANMEDQIHQSLAQLERIRQMTITPKNSAAKSAKPEDAKPAEAPAPVPEAPKVEVKKPSPDEMSREIEVNISRILAGQPEPVEDALGDTRVIHPLKQ